MFRKKKDKPEWVRENYTAFILHYNFGRANIMKSFKNIWGDRNVSKMLLESFVL